MNEEKLVVDVESIGEKYEAKGYFRRLKEMFVGLGQPHDTPEYKLARIELQRQTAPLIAIVSVTLFFIVLVVVTSMTGPQKDAYEVQIAEIVQDPVIDPEPEPEPEPTDLDPVTLELVDVQVDAPFLIIDPTPADLPQSQPVTVKPATQDSVAFVDSPVKMPSIMGSRTPGSIGEVTKGGAAGGDKMTELTVMKVLWWLKAHQKSDGSWAGGNTLANTSLAVLTYLAHGEYPGSKSPFQKDFGPVVQLALDYIVGCVNQNGGKVTIKGSDGNEYAFLIATYALCEAYGMTKNPNCKDAAYVCLDRIVRGQSPTGGWDYKINPKSDRDDMSFAGWALQALKAGKMAGLRPEGIDECIKKAVRCLQMRNFKGGGFNYVAESNTPTGLTATGCLAMQLLGYGNKPEVSSALDFMREWKPAFDKGALSAKGVGSSPQYYCYYATQCKYQAGMKQGATKKDETAWHNWNAAMKQLYPKSIIDEPTKVKDWSGNEHEQGYYKNADAHTSRPVMDTCLVALQLMVYYRYLPTTQTSAALADDAGDSAIAAVDKNDIPVVVDDL